MKFGGRHSSSSVARSATAGAAVTPQVVYVHFAVVVVEDTAAPAGARSVVALAGDIGQVGAVRNAGEVAITRKASRKTRSE